MRRIVGFGVGLAVNFTRGAAQCAAAATEEAGNEAALLCFGALGPVDAGDGSCILCVANG